MKPTPPLPAIDSIIGSSATEEAYFSESQLPSCKSGFYTAAEERTTRRRTCRFLEEAGRVLKLPRVTISTSMVFFHRFYAVHSFEDHDRFEVSVACILLAAKTEESPKKLHVVIQECFKLKNLSTKAKKQQQQHEEIPGVILDKRGYLDAKCEEFVRLKDRILLLERVILHTIGFELSVNHPYIYFGKIKTMIASRQLQYIQPLSSSSEEPGKMFNQLTQYSMNFANDSMHTSLCLQFPPDKIAYACIYLSGQFCKLKPTDDKKWLDILDISMDELVSIGLQIMELIADKKGVDKSIFDSVRSDLDGMKRKVQGAPVIGDNSNKAAMRPPSLDDRESKKQRI
eukprot:CAMPEP_0176491682 /NCGR_PEP_ID=MMETSP0200_2-20121128/8564_1 /TAXON_ID=947934 /ORGANISM="Chaetoceros sp., Strain GSL56" /LENGTH=341 /DNA_ID=CAMNT_0017889131 /DNA_START=58 /DNA_END=1083 /DNA_ORIENTATION=+